MADWFKFYENDLDETRLQYAISKIPEVIPVWVGILSEACRHKSGTISWGIDEIELFGFSRRLGVSIPKVNEAVNVLCEIRYITKADSKITILKWGEKQSEYCQKMTRRQNQSGGENPNSQKVSGQTPDKLRQEERRGEENKKKEPAALSSAMVVVYSKELERVTERIKTIRGTYAAHQDWCGDDIKEYSNLLARKRELNNLLGVKI